MRRSGGIRGFTLIEMAVLCVLAGVLLMGAMSAYNTYAREKRLTETYTKQDTITSAIASFSDASGTRYPCPAPILYPLDDPRSGIEDCTMRDDITIPVGTCDPDTGICKVAGRATDFFPNGEVLIGGIPYKDIKAGGELQACFDPLDLTTKVECSSPGAIRGEACEMLDGTVVHCSTPGALRRNDVSFKNVSQQDIIDSWGNQMTYAVTMSQTNVATYRPSYGAVAIETEHGESLVDPPGSAHYVIVSSGERSTGAFSIYGNQATNCADATADERENCDWGAGYPGGGDALFISGLLSRDYDDILSFVSYTLSEVWRYTTDGKNIYNINEGNIGVGIGGTTVPEEKLDVGGTVGVTGDIVTGQICPRGAPASECWSPELIGGPDGLVCTSQAGDPPNTYRLLAGIRNKQPVCTDPIPRVEPTPATLLCPPGEYIYGYTRFAALCREP